MIHAEWQEIAGTIIDGGEVTRFLNGYFQSTREENDYGIGYLLELRVKYPEYSDRLDHLIAIPCIGVYVTHWFLEKGGAISR